MKILTSLSKNWSKVKSWFKAEQSANKIETKHIVIEPNDAKEVKTTAFRPVFHSGGYYNNSPYFPGTNENRKRKHNKIHKSRMLRKKHRKAA